MTAFVQNLLEATVQQDAQETALANEFLRLADQWRDETWYCSFAKQKAEHPAYQKIVALGRKAVPLILAELERRPSHWFGALHEITGANPVPSESRGKLDEMTKAWLKWGREQGYRNP